MKRLISLTLCAAALAFGQGPRRAPGFCLPDTSMHFHDLADYRGKVVVLEFIQTTCPHCAAFADILREAQTRYGDKIQIISLAVQETNPAAVPQYISGHKITYPVMMDMGQIAFSYIRQQGMEFPRLYIIDRDGYIAGDFGYGLTTRDIFEGKGLFTQLDKFVGAAAKPPAKK